MEKQKEKETQHKKHEHKKAHSTHDKKLKELELQVLDLMIKNQTLEAQVKESNEQYINKIKEKEQQAQNVIKEHSQKLRLQTSKEIDEIKKYGIANKVEKLLQTLQTFEMALSSPSSNPEVRAYMQGFNMVKDMYKQALEDIGITEIIPKVGDDADYSQHEGIEIIEDSNFESGKIIKVKSNGYKLYDRVIEPAKVSIAK